MVVPATQVVVPFPKGYRITDVELVPCVVTHTERSVIEGVQEGLTSPEPPEGISGSYDIGLGLLATPRGGGRRIVSIGSQRDEEDKQCLPPPIPRGACIDTERL